MEPEPNKVVVKSTVTSDLYRELQARAANSERSVSAQIRLAIREHLRAQETS